MAIYPIAPKITAIPAAVRPVRRRLQCFGAFFFFKSLGDIFYRLGELRDHDIIERIGALLRFLYRVGKAIDAVLYLRKLCGHTLDLREAQICFVKLGVGRVEPVIHIELLLAERNNRQLNAHDAAKVNIKRLVYRYRLRELSTHTERDVRTLEREIGL